MKKIALFLSLTLLFLSMLASCAPSGDGEGTGNGDNGGNGGSQPTPPSSGDVATADKVWSDEFVSNIVVSDEDVYGLLNDLTTHIFEASGNIPTVNPSGTMNLEHEISLGDTGTAISKKAYRIFEDSYALDSLFEQHESAWLIYAEGGSLAVVYSDTIAKKEALDYIFDNFNDVNFAPNKGVVAKDKFDTEDYLEVLREEERKAVYDAMEDVLGADAVLALKKVYSLYDTELYVWMANLYCPDVGGFYYSNSARDNEGFLPDLESTAQILGTLERTGLADAYEDNWTKLLPYEVRENILAFAKGLQDPDGYFYHPQWGTSISRSRRGRDAGWARNIITRMNARPNYTYAADQIELTSSVVPLTGRFDKGTAVAVSYVVSVAKEDDIYSSEARFIEYLDSLNFAENSYSAGNEISSTVSTIKNHGLWETLKKYLIEHQNPSNGLWEDEVSYQSVNGLMKLCTVFGSSYPNADKAMDSAIEILKLPITDEMSGITYVYNPWVAIANLLNAVSEVDAKELRDMLHREAADIFEMTAEKLGAFAKPDGGFSYGREYSAPYSQDALVAVNGMAESDVNATSIAITTVVRYVREVYKLEFPTVYCTYDSVYFLNHLAEMGTIIKNRAEDPVVDTFDDFEESDGQIIDNVVMRPGNYINNVIGDTDGGADGYKWFESAIVPNPTEPEGTDDLVLYVGDMIYPDEDKKIANEASKTEFKISNFSVPGTCYVFEADMLFNSVEDTSAPLAQLTFVREGSALISAWVDFYQYKRFGQNYIRIQEYFAAADGIKDTEVASGIPVDDWFKLRVELYKEYDTDTGAVIMNMKIFVNGVLAGVCDSGHYDTSKGEYKDFVISMIRLSYYRHTASSLYLNNVFAGKTNQTFTPEQGKLEEGEVVDKEEIWDFEDGIPSEEDNFSEIFYKKDDVICSMNPVDWNDDLEDAYAKVGSTKLYGATDPQNAANKVIKAYSYNTKSSAYRAMMYVNDNILSAEGSTYEIKFDYYFEMIPWLYASDFFSVNIQNKNGSKMAAVTFAAPNASTDHSNATSLGIKIGDDYVEDVEVKYNRWYSFKMNYFYNPAAPSTSRMVISMLYDGQYVCIADEVLPCKVDEVARIGFGFHSYEIRGTQYIDDVSVSRTDLKYTYVAPNTEIDDNIGYEGDNAIYITESSRGNGVYNNKSISYTKTSYQRLIQNGFMAKNIARGDGTELVEDLVKKIVREIAIKDDDSNDAFVYTTTGSGNHAINFVSQAPAYEGFIFETDIKLVDIDNYPDRFIRFTGTKTNGIGNSDLWDLSLRFTKNVNEDVGGATMTLAGSEKLFGIPNNTWVNVRLEASGLYEGSDLTLYVNGVAVETIPLGGSIEGIVGIELYTSSTHNGHGWEKGSIYLDNTYVSGTGEAPAVHEITETSRGEGEYCESALNYSSTTYADLLADGYMAINKNREDGIDAGNRTVSLKDVDENAAFVYTAVGSSIHTLNFTSQKAAYNGFVFETDLKLSGVNTSEARDIRFQGTTYVEADSKLYTFNIKIHKNPDEEVGGYVIRMAGNSAPIEDGETGIPTKETCLVMDDSWFNIRLVAKGLEKNAPVELYINGELTMTTYLTSSIQGISGMELFTQSTYNGNQGWTEGSIYLDNTYVSGIDTRSDFPEATGTSRGDGDYKNLAISYDGLTYQELIEGGDMVKNTARGDGVSAGNRTVSIVDVNGNQALKYATTGSGNHSLNFALDNPIYTGLVFETDIMLENVNVIETRELYFIGTTTNGSANADGWNVQIKFAKNPVEDQGGYLLTVAGVNMQIVIPEATWANVRVIYSGYRMGEAIYVYVNGYLVGEGFLRGDITSYKGIELYTPSTYNGDQGWTEGSIYLDNTYVTGTGEAPEEEPEVETPVDSNLNGSNIDNPAWDVN